MQDCLTWNLPQVRLDYLVRTTTMDVAVVAGSLPRRAQSERKVNHLPFLNLKKKRKKKKTHHSRFPTHANYSLVITFCFFSGVIVPVFFQQRGSVIYRPTLEYLAKSGRKKTTISYSRYGLQDLLYIFHFLLVYTNARAKHFGLYGKARRSLACSR